MNKNYLNKFSFGISLGIELDNYSKLLSQYGEYISSVYFSLPYGDEFHTRLGVKEEYGLPGAKEKLIEILKLFKSKGVKLEAILNQYHIDNVKIKQALNDLDSYIRIDSICCLDEYREIINNHYSGNMYMVSSFNNKPLHEKDISSFSAKNEYDMIVLSKEFMRRPDLIRKIRNNGIDVKLLVNNGCSFNCGGCRAGSRQCIKVFEKNLEYSTPEELYALQSFFPWELNYLFNTMGASEYVDEIKVSSRPSTYEYLNKCLRSYIYNESVEKYILEDKRNYYLWGRQSNLTPYHFKFNVSEINNIKREIWKELQ